MKTKLLLSSLLSFYFCLLSSQVPLGFNYQAIARDGSGTILANQALPVKIDIQTSLTGGSLIYEELFASVTSNQFGLISLVIGTGTQTGGSATSFSAIDWKAQTLFLKTIIQYPGTIWTTMGTSQIWGVPYSLVAKEVAGPLTKLGIAGTTTDMEEALFEVKNQAGNTVFAVYNEGIRAYVGNGSAKGAKGGFAVGGYDATKGSSTIYNLLTINTDSARLYFDSNPTLKGKKGGFSVGGYDMTKDGTSVQNYLDVTPAATQIFTTDTVKGFAVGNVSTGNTANYLKLTPSNYFIGHETGKSLSSGLYNVFLGYQAGLSMNNGANNSLIGYKSGNSLIEGWSDVFIGNNTGSKATGAMYSILIGNQAGADAYFTSSGGWKNIDNCMYIGNSAGRNDQFPAGNMFIGDQSGMNNKYASANNLFIGISSGLNNNGSENLFIGMSDGENNQGSYNTFIGYQSGLYNTNGTRNLYLGYKPGFLLDTCSDNVIIGYKAGWYAFGNNNTYIGNNCGWGVTGSGHILIGPSSGYFHSGSNTLAISTSQGTPLICGDFLSHKVGINCNYDETQTLDVNGNARFRSVSSGIFGNDLNITADGTLTTSTSDIRMKDNISVLSDALEKIMKLRGVTFTWKNDPAKNRQIGMIAQEVEQIVPEIVFTNPVDGLKGINYSQAVSILVEAIKEQQQQIESTKQENQQLKSESQAMKERLDRIEGMMADGGSK